LCAGDKDKTGIVAHRLEPVPDVGDVVFEIVACRDAQFPAQEAGTDLGDEFAKGVGVLPLLAGPVQAARMLRPVAPYAVNPNVG